MWSFLFIWTVFLAWSTLVGIVFRDVSRWVSVRFLPSLRVFAFLKPVCRLPLASFGQSFPYIWYNSRKCSLFFGSNINAVFLHSLPRLSFEGFAPRWDFEHFLACLLGFRWAIYRSYNSSTTTILQRQARSTLRQTELCIIADRSCKTLS